MADFIATYNNHHVWAMRSGGCHRPTHIPTMAFQAIIRSRGKVLPPAYPYPEGAMVRPLDGALMRDMPNGVDPLAQDM